MKTLAATEEPIRLVACFRPTDMYRPTARHEIARPGCGLLRRLRNTLACRRMGLPWRQAWAWAPCQYSGPVAVKRSLTLSSAPLSGADR